ncbi:Rho GTPase activation protein [Hymenopellis radicata]|nr:Rho GTPase activation protein [Hymenopellis radicata]
MSSSIPSQPPSPSRPERSREFFFSADLYVSNAASATLRKPPALRKRPNKRDTKHSNGAADDSKKVKEKSSWLTLARGSATTGQWRAAQCKLTEEGEQCLLNIYVDESILFQTLYIHLVNHTDIRQADTSLFFRKNCLGIYSSDSQSWGQAASTQPVYLQFANPEACNMWLVLLRSYANTEIYGRRMYREDGGSYRMWRQVEVVVIQARNLGNPKPLDSNVNESSSEPDPIDLDVSCEINLNAITCGRTTVKKCIGSPDWHESFTFSDLPPFENLEVIVCREKKLFKPTALGSVCINLLNFKRGELIDGWFPVLQSGPLATDIQVGDIRLKITVDEEIILPSHAYQSLLDTYNTRNFLDWMTDFERKLKLKTVVPQLIAIGVAQNNLVEKVQELAWREVDGTSSHQTLFRGNTILTKVMEACMNWYGKAFLEASIGTVLRKLCAERVAIEVDPMRSGGKSTAKDVERNVDLLIHWCGEFWTQIYSVRTECPYEMRRLFETIRKLVERRYNADNTPENGDLHWQSVSAFCFLRFIVPAILHPHLFGLCPGLPSVPVQRSLTLIAKVIQSLANLNATVQKEEFMRGLKDFLRERVTAMRDYILLVSTPDIHASPSSSGDAGRHERLAVMKAMRERQMISPGSTLDSEAIPVLPHMLDMPRHLAIITSAVIRNSREFMASPPSEDDRPLRELCAQCFMVEGLALQRVSHIASSIGQPYPSANWQSSTLPQSLIPTLLRNSSRHKLGANLIARQRRPHPLILVSAHSPQTWT